MKRKDYYTFADLLVRLRRDYREIRKILKEMEKCILVNSLSKTKFEISFVMRDPRLSKDEKPKLRISVTRENTPLSEKFKRVIMTTQLGRLNPITPLIDSATFYYTIDGDIKSFEFDNKYNFKHAFAPVITVPDGLYMHFRDLCDRLKQNRLYSLPAANIVLNPYQHLSIDGSGLTLFNGSGENRLIDIGYDAKTDRASVESNKRYNGLRIEEMFMTQIPRYLLPAEWTTSLDMLHGSVRDVDAGAAEITGRGKVSFALSLENEELGLTKKIGQKK